MFNDGGRMKEIKFGNPTCEHCGVTYPITEQHNCIFSQDAKFKRMQAQIDSLTEAVELYRTTLLDQFATAAMQALLSNPEYSISKEDAAKYGSGDAVTAHYAYKQAVAMLAARKEG